MVKISSIFLLVLFISCKKEIPNPLPNLCGKTLVFIGDSQVEQSWWNESIGLWYNRLTGQSVIYAGVSGQTSIQCADRYEATVECKTCPVFVAIGRNNNWQSEQIKYDLRRIIGNKTEYFIYEIVTGDWPNEYPNDPSGYWAHDQQLNREIIEEWGIDHFIEATQSLQALAPEDVESKEKGIVPTKFRADALHLNSEGNREIAKILIGRLMPCPQTVQAN